MKTETWKLIEDFFIDSPRLKAEPVPYEVIDKHFDDHHFRIPEDYREFLHRYGAGILGAYTIYGIGSCKLMGNDSESARKVTEFFKSQSWPGIDGWLIISVDTSGNPIGMDDSGKIGISDVVHGCVDELANDFEEFICEWCMDFEDD
jgi:hypothetical protein